MSTNEPTFTKLNLARQIFVKTFYKKVYKNPTDSLVVNTKTPKGLLTDKQTEGRIKSPHKVFI